MKARIDIRPSVSLGGRACAIVAEPDIEAMSPGVPHVGLIYRLYKLDGKGLADELAASGPDPRRLAEYAFGAGAQSVRHDYDLREWVRG